MASLVCMCKENCLLFANVNTIENGEGSTTPHVKNRKYTFSAYTALHTGGPLISASHCRQLSRRARVRALA